MFLSRALVVIGLLLAWPSLGRSELRFSRPAVNLGELRGGPVYPHRFEFVNDSGGPIEIIDVRLGCGCLKMALDKRVYQPGEKGTLLMHLRTLGQPDGPRSWQSYVKYREGDKIVETRLILGATLRNEVTVEPSIVAMSVETTLRQEIVITDHRPTPLKVIAVRASSSALRVSTQPQGTGVTKLLLEVSGSALTAARQEETLTIDTEDPDYRRLEVPITLMKAIRAPVSASPDRLEFSGSASGSKLVRLRAAGDRKVVVDRVETDHPALKCTWASGPGDDATLKITLDGRQATTAPAQSSIRIHLAQPSAMTMTIPVMVQKD